MLKQTSPYCIQGQDIKMLFFRIQFNLSVALLETTD